MKQKDLEEKRRKQSLDELEGKIWNRSDFDSHLVRACFKLRKKPIGDFTVEELRIMIGQQIGALFLVPIALEILEKNPLAEGDYYPGDLLASVTRLDASFWQKHSQWQARLEHVIASAKALPKGIIESVERFRSGTSRAIASG